MQVKQSSKLALLPDEVIQQVLEHASPHTAVALQSTSRRFREVTREPLLWRGYCLRTFDHWSSRHRIDQKLRSKEAFDWKRLFIERCETDVKVSRELDAIIESETNRHSRFQSIVERGYDSKDTLLWNLSVGEDEPDRLARRYWSHAVISSLHRNAALETWLALKRDPQNLSMLEQGLGAFNLFIRGGDPGGQSEITARLDSIAERVRREYPDMNDLPDRQQAVKIAEFLLVHKLVGINSDQDYHALPHNFIGVALSTDDHSSLPLISVALYCAVCIRLNLRAATCSIPYHVYAVIYPRDGIDLDGNARMGYPQPMYMDPWRSSTEVPASSIRQQLNMLPNIQTSGPIDDFLAPSSSLDITLRCTRNVLHSIQQFNPRAFVATTTSDDPASRIDIPSARYAALWASVLLSSTSGFPGANFLHLHHELLTLLHLFANHFPNDIYLVEQHLLPMIEVLPGNYINYLSSVRDMRQRDALPRQPKKRSSYHPSHIKYRIGQVFKHKRYGYRGVIMGWDAKCDAREEWIETMGVDDLDGGRNQSFYNALVLQDLSIRYVASENVSILEYPETDGFFIDPTTNALSSSSSYSSSSPQQPAELNNTQSNDSRAHLRYGMPRRPKMFLQTGDFALDVGKYFKRWDRERGVFVGNMDEEYPED